MRERSQPAKPHRTAQHQSGGTQWASKASRTDNSITLSPFRVSLTSYPWKHQYKQKHPFLPVTFWCCFHGHNQMNIHLSSHVGKEARPMYFLSWQLLSLLKTFLWLLFFPAPTPTINIKYLTIYYCQGKEDLYSGRVGWVKSYSTALCNESTREQVPGSPGNQRRLSL